jgi:hypothetical protein
MTVFVNRRLGIEAFELARFEKSESDQNAPSEDIPTV